MQNYGGQIGCVVGNVEVTHSLTHDFHNKHHVQISGVTQLKMAHYADPLDKM